MKLYVFFLFVLFCLASCGKHETTGGTLGALSGAALGTAVAGRHDKGAGAVLGALAGAVVGSAVGRSADDDDADELESLRRENRRLRNKKSVVVYEKHYVRPQVTVVRPAVVRPVYHCCAPAPVYIID